MTAPSNAKDFFDTYSGDGGGGAPAFKFQQIGDTVKGIVVSTRPMEQTLFGSNPPKPIPDPKRPGQNKMQLQVILETKLRDWAGCNPGKDRDGNQEPPSADTGSRAIYVKGWMIGAISSAVSAATNGERRHLLPGDKVAVQFSESEDTGKGNPLKKFSANVVPTAAGAEVFNEAEEERATAPVNAAAMSLDDDEDEMEAPF